ncbi:hypothetical protein [Aeromicrobium sp. IC_218]|uniref:hypothetical protein n=1 Tax=Aeromicrobium sp. IC_218 TaxID=2545468 RepID=UPI00103DA50B|nr:hypothetical protein [Aeromicrobium sp. IC_218]TCI96026.1 hypothetical protein E0W78_15420 [Aeromicrobium sp. IC_218]
MSSEPTTTHAPSRDRTEAGDWLAIGGFVLLVAVLLAGTGWTSAEGDARAALVALGAVTAIAGFLLLVVGAVIAGTTIALRTERARLEQERSAPQAD